MTRFLRTVATTMLIGISVAACAQRPPPVAAATVATPSFLGEYILQPGDRIGIRPVLDAAYGVVAVLPPDGRIDVPGVSGRVQAAGRTVPELSDLLEARFAAANVLVHPLFTINLLDIAQKQIFVGGEVRRPGPVSVRGAVRSLLQVIVARGGPLPTANLAEVAVIRVTPNGHLSLMAFDLSAAMNGTDLAQNAIVQPTDIVVVPRTRVAQLDVWVDQYIRRASPVPLAFALRLSNTPRGAIIP